MKSEMEPPSQTIHALLHNRSGRTISTQDHIENFIATGSPMYYICLLQLQVTFQSKRHFGVRPLLGFPKKKTRNARGFAREFIRSRRCCWPGRSVKRHGKSSSPHSKKNFLLGRCGFFCEWRHKWRTFRPPWLTSPGPGRQPLDGSISLKFLLETRLQSESFDTLDDLLGFRVQKLWSKVIKTFD